MTNPNTGLFTWHELMTTEAVSGAKFYCELFGWTVHEVDMGPMGTYRVFLQGERQVAGGMSAPPGVPPHWLSYVSVESVDAAAAKITEFHGKILVPPTDVPGLVRFSVAMDPQGASFGVIQDLSGRPIEALPKTPPPGSFCWDELMTKDVDAGAKYYGAVFGWTGKSSEGAMKYWHWNQSGKDFAGMLPLMMPNVPPNWLPYIAVADVDASTAKVQALGGKVLMPAMEIEKTGRFSVVQDPAGATFALFRSLRV